MPQGHLAHFISDTINALDLSAFFARNEGGGSCNQPFHAVMMVKVLVYGYATGVFSSRKIPRKLHEDVAFRVLAAGNFPKHRTLCDFRALHLNELAPLFVQVVKLAGECGLVKLGAIAVDDTKLRANASKHKAMSYPSWTASLVTSARVRPLRVAMHANASSLRSSICTRLKGDTKLSGNLPPDFVFAFAISAPSSG